jgi:signal transduction histidine kinase
MSFAVEDTPESGNLAGDKSVAVSKNVGLEEFETEVGGRSGATPELAQQLWGFAKAGYLDSPMPPLLKERLFVWLSRFCPLSYCIVRHVGYLLGYGRPAGEAQAPVQALEDVLALLKRPTPWQRAMEDVYQRLAALPAPLAEWPQAGSEHEDWLFACAAVMFVEPMRSARAQEALQHALGAREFELLCAFLGFVGTAHYWTLLHPGIELEEDAQRLLREHEELRRLLFEDPERKRYEISERPRAELEDVREQHERLELEKVRRALEEKEHQKERFFAILGHELRTPLAAIRAATDTLKLLELRDPRVAPLQERLDRQTAAMGRMLNDLLDASRIAFGKVALRWEPVDLRELLREMLGEQEPRIRQADLRLEWRITSAPCRVRGDRARLGQIVDKLLSNAAKFTPAGGTISLTLATEGGAAVVSVDDSGVGFDTALAPRLFEPFVQLEQGLDRRSGGLGLGLAIASRLARLQGGSLTGTSDGPGLGARFQLRLPLSPVEAGEDQHAAAPAAPWPAQLCVLVVEDNPEVADGMAEMLRLGGFQVTVARNGASAIGGARALIPDVILCDLGSPGELDGFAVARACRADPALRSTRLIAVSGNDSPEEQARAKSAGFECLLAKPLRHESLAALLDLH